MNVRQPVLISSRDNCTLLQSCLGRVQNFVCVTCSDCHLQSSLVLSGSQCAQVLCLEPASPGRAPLSGVGLVPVCCSSSRSQAVADRDGTRANSRYHGVQRTRQNGYPVRQETVESSWLQNGCRITLLMFKLKTRDLSVLLIVNMAPPHRPVDLRLGFHVRTENRQERALEHGKGLFVKSAHCPCSDPHPSPLRHFHTLLTVSWSYSTNIAGVESHVHL